MSIVLLHCTCTQVCGDILNAAAATTAATTTTITAATTAAAAAAADYKGLLFVSKSIVLQEAILEDVSRIICLTQF